MGLNPPHRPHRTSDVRAWLREWREEFGLSSDRTAYMVVDALINDYDRRAAFGSLLGDDPADLPPRG